MIPIVNKYSGYTIQVTSSNPEALKDEFEAIPLGSSVTFSCGKYWCSCIKATDDWKEYVVPAVAALFKSATDIPTIV